jgi:predicted phosphoribosyltransferase
MSDFANLADAGRRLGPVLRGALAFTPDPVLLAVIPNGVPVALGIRDQVGLPVRGLPVERSEDGVIVRVDASLAGRNVVIVDDGVETGTVARAAAAAMVEAGVASVVLAVPVCSRESEASLQHRYDQIVALSRPMVHRSLSRHFADFDTIDEATALRLLADLPADADLPGE